MVSGSDEEQANPLQVERPRAEQYPLAGDSERLQDRQLLGVVLLRTDPPVPVGIAEPRHGQKQIKSIGSGLHSREVLLEKIPIIGPSQTPTW